MSHDTDDARYPVQKTDREWRESLDPTQYRVARHGDTERAFTGKYWNHWADGSYRCVGCGQVLFDSGTKFDAGCGWPSWWKEIEPGRIERIEDHSHGMTRIEVRCALGLPMLCSAAGLTLSIREKTENSRKTWKKMAPFCRNFHSVPHLLRKTFRFEIGLLRACLSVLS